MEDRKATGDRAKLVEWGEVRWQQAESKGMTEGKPEGNRGRFWAERVRRLSCEKGESRQERRVKISADNQKENY